MTIDFQGRPRRPLNRRNIIIGAAVLAVILIGALFIILGGGGHDEKAAPAADERPGSAQAVTAATVISAPLPRVITASGTVSPWEEVPVGAETGGLVATAVYVDEGRYVRQGQPLVQLNDTLLRAQLRQQDAQVASARATLAESEAALARARELRERGFLAQAGLDQATARAATAQAGLQAAEAARGETAARVAQTTIRAPVSGQIISRSVTRGQIVQPGVELFRITRDGRLELDAQVPETELPLLRPGMTATISSDEAGTATGVVRIVTPEVDPQSRLGVARISLSAGSGLRPGMFARAQIDAGATGALVIPSTAIVYREGQPGVYVVGANNTVSFRRVTPGARQGDLLAVQGVQAGERVVVQGAGFLGEGDPVRVTAAAARPAAQPAEKAG
ncbi:efflux RND transporter periplasmic adaptor subunit [Brevundimonas sp. 2R-24]|uniref:Efflux RND transporter periplasmic adaptor subunit n=1 Tax=Peiella sedimenti TaxID=3061083 RepID=A0ABT8SHC1_9CAUL|nr:efflux RND transporter periplasmic adaptor subunit [Caulobacteraceae bacterium XZ-24]